MKQFINILLLVLLGILTNNIVYFSLKDQLNENVTTPGFISVIPLIAYAIFHYQRWPNLKLKTQHYLWVILTGLLGLFLDLYFIQKAL